MTHGLLGRIVGICGNSSLDLEIGITFPNSLPDEPVGCSGSESFSSQVEMLATWRNHVAEAADVSWAYRGGRITAQMQVFRCTLFNKPKKL